MPRLPALSDALAAAVSGIGGTPRPGQQQMAEAVADGIRTGEHLLVQAGTGTGKSLGYLIPAVLHAIDTGNPVVVATATLALQAQIVDRDMPRLADAIAPLVGRRPTYALVKGRRNYVCVNKLHGGYPSDEETLFGAADPTSQRGASQLGAEVTRLREWAEETESGDRDDLVPGVSEKAWRQVSVAAHECLGTHCPFVAECFVERARAHAHEVDVVVTNHSFMAIDSFEGRQMLPAHDLVIVDEGHELVDRVTATIADEMTSGSVTSAARSAAAYADTADLAVAAETLGAALETLEPGRLVGLPESLGTALSSVLASARLVASGLKSESSEAPDGARAVARAAVNDVFDVAERLLEERELDVVWIGDEPRRGKVLHVAPMSVAMLLRDKLFSDRTVVLTSATLELGGSFDAVAGTLGLRGEGAPTWRGLDVGSPFDYPKQAMVYVASHLPPPGRDGLGPELLDEIETLVRASGGRALGLFSSMRAAQQAAEEMRARLDVPILLQGEDQLPTLVRTFARDAQTCLFGTLSLWQGVDVPGSACQLVIIDRIPFPRPDDPLASARSQAIGRMGGNGFMAVAATHAALRLAQGTGRLVRHADDKGVVAILDSRMVTARYAGFLQASLPPFWPTTDRALVLGALARLDAGAADVVPVIEPATRNLKSAPTVRPHEPGESEHPAPVAGAASTGAPVAPAARNAVTGGYPWNDDEDEELRDAVEAGISAEEAADHLGIPLEAVRTRAAQLGLEFDNGEVEGQDAFSFD